MQRRNETNEKKNVNFKKKFNASNSFPLKDFIRKFVINIINNCKLIATKNLLAAEIK